MTAGAGELLGLAAALELLASLVSATQGAFAGLGRSAAEHLARTRPRSAAAWRRVGGDPARAAALLLARTACEVTATVAVTVVLARGATAGPAGIVLAAAVMTVVGFLAIGAVGRSLGQRYAAALVGVLALPAAGLAGLLRPVSGLLLRVGSLLVPGRVAPAVPLASEAELRELVEQAAVRGAVDRREQELLHSVFDLGETLVREVMVPRLDMVTVERHRSVRQALGLALRSGFSRLPVTGEGTDDVVGIAYLKDLTRRQVDGRAEEAVTEVMRPVTYTPDTKKADELLREMQARRIHLAVVVDEYGGTAGLVTIEDVLEEIVGEITDEYDRELPPVEHLPDGRLRVTARLSVADLAEATGVVLDRDDVDTVGGLLAAELGRVPIPGAKVEVSGLMLEAESAAGRRNRIGTVLVSGVVEGARLPSGAGSGPRGGHRPPGAAPRPVAGGRTGPPGTSAKEGNRQ